MANGNKPLPGVSQRSKLFETSILSRQNNTQCSLGTRDLRTKSDVSRTERFGPGHMTDPWIPAWIRFEYSLEQKNAIVVNVKRVEFKLVLILEIGLS